MQFKGTPRFPAGLLDKAISRDGGYWNAMTWLDWTAYFETMPAGSIDLGLRLEADRMVHSLIEADEFESERTVVIVRAAGQRERAHLPPGRGGAGDRLPRAPLPP